MKQEQDKSIEKFIDMVKDVKICMMITKEKNVENLSGRPMAINKIDEDGTMWFFTKASSHKVDEIEDNHKVSLAITSESNGSYLMIHGSSNLSYDKGKMEESWNSTMKTWFPMGLNDPDLALISVKPTEVNYWDTSSGKMISLLSLLKSLTGQENYDEKYGKINL